MRFVTAYIVTGLFLCTCLTAQINKDTTRRFISSTDVIRKVVTVPSYALDSPSDLANYIKTHTDNEYDCVRFIFYWLAVNIEYDSAEQTHLETASLEQNVQTIFKEKKAICADYAALFKFLCEKCGIASRIVDGWANTLDLSFLRLHAWNIVRINNIWYPVDVTWAAGNISRGGLDINKIISLNTDFFLDASLKYRRTHFPFDPAFQLSSSLINKLDFMNYDDDTNTIMQRGICDYRKILNEETNLSPDEQTLCSYERAAGFLPEEPEVIQNFHFYGLQLVQQLFEKLDSTYKNLSAIHSQELSGSFTGDRAVFIVELKKISVSLEDILIVIEKIIYSDDAGKKQLLEENKLIIKDRLSIINEVISGLERLQSVYLPALSKIKN